MIINTRDLRICSDWKLPQIERQLGNCPTCQGDGEVHSHNPTCWTCQGTGSISQEKWDRMYQRAVLSTYRDEDDKYILRYAKEQKKKEMLEADVTRAFILMA